MKTKFKEFLNENIETSIENELNIIDEIDRKDINGDVPVSAVYALLDNAGKDIIKFYKMVNKKFNDGTNMDILVFWGEQGGWHPSSYNNKDGKDYKNLKNHKFLKIIN